MHLDERVGRAIWRAICLKENGRFYDVDCVSFCGCWLSISRSKTRSIHRIIRWDHTVWLNQNNIIRRFRDSGSDLIGKERPVLWTPSEILLWTGFGKVKNQLNYRYLFFEIARLRSMARWITSMVTMKDRSAWERTAGFPNAHRPQKSFCGSRKVDQVQISPVRPVIFEITQFSAQRSDFYSEDENETQEATWSGRERSALWTPSEILLWMILTNHGHTHTLCTTGSHWRYSMRSHTCEIWKRWVGEFESDLIGKGAISIVNTVRHPFVNCSSGNKVENLQDWIRDEWKHIVRLPIEHDKMSTSLRSFVVEQQSAWEGNGRFLREALITSRSP